MNWMNRISDARCGTQHTAQGLYGLAHLIGHCRGLVSRKQRVPSERCNYAHDHLAGIEDRPAAVSRIHMSVGDDNNILSAAVCKKAGSETLLKSGVIDDPTRCGPNLRNRFTRLQSQGWVCHNFAERHIAKVEIEDLCATATSRSERTRQWNGYH